MLPTIENYDELYGAFQWQIPEKFNIGVAVSDAWAAKEPERICLQHFNPDGGHRTLTYGAFSQQSSAFARGLERQGIRPGDRVAILLPQGFEAAIAHAAIYKLGAIALPLALLFGVEALEYRLLDAGAAAIVTNAFGHERVAAIRDAAAGSAAGRAGRRRTRSRHARLHRPCLRRCRWFCCRRYHARRCGIDDLHLRDDRAAQGRAAWPPGAARPSAGVSVSPSFPAATG